MKHSFKKDTLFYIEGPKGAVDGEFWIMHYRADQHFILKKIQDGVHQIVKIEKSGKEATRELERMLAPKRVDLFLTSPSRCSCGETNHNLPLHKVPADVINKMNINNASIMQIFAQYEAWLKSKAPKEDFQQKSIRNHLAETHRFILLHPQAKFHVG